MQFYNIFNLTVCTQKFFKIPVHLSGACSSVILSCECGCIRNDEVGVT